MKLMAELYYKRLEELLNELRYIYRFESSARTLVHIIPKYEKLLADIKEYFEHEYK